jgi:Sigma-70 region 2
LIAAAEVVANLETVTIVTPTHESQVRPLTFLCFLKKSVFGKTSAFEDVAAQGRKLGFSKTNQKLVFQKPRLALLALFRFPIPRRVNILANRSQCNSAMHAPLIPPRDSTLKHSTWRGGVNGTHYFDSTLARQLIESYNRSGDEGALCQFLEHAEPLICSIIQYRDTVRHESADELLSRVRIKLWRSVRLYDPAKGTAFSFVAKIIQTTLASAVGEAWSRSERFCPFSQSTDFAIQGDPVASTEAIADIQARVRMVRTPCRDQSEIDAQKWLVASFIDAEFALRRHEASDSMSMVYGLSHGESRRLFDLTLIAIRRELLAGRRLKPINPRSLVQTRSAAIVKYVRFVSADEFTRLATLTRDVAPSIILTVNRHNVCAIRRGEPEATRANLRLVLYGSPTDRPLFG